MSNNHLVHIDAPLSGKVQRTVLVSCASPNVPSDSTLSIHNRLLSRMVCSKLSPSPPWRLFWTRPIPVTTQDGNLRWQQADKQPDSPVAYGKTREKAEPNEWARITSYQSVKFHFFFNPRQKITFNSTSWFSKMCAGAEFACTNGSHVRRFCPRPSSSYSRFHLTLPLCNPPPWARPASCWK